MAVDVTQLNMPDFLTLLGYEGNPPPGKEFDHLRMSRQEWAALFPPGPSAPRREGGRDAGVPEAATPPH